MIHARGLVRHHSSLIEEIMSVRDGPLLGRLGGISHIGGSGCSLCGDYERERIGKAGEGVTDDG